MLYRKPGHKVNTCVQNPRTVNRRRNTRSKKSRTEEKTSNTQEEYNPNPVSLTPLSDISYVFTSCRDMKNIYMS